MHDCFNQSSCYRHECVAQAGQLWLTSGTCEPVIAILVSPAAVSCEVVALVVLKVRLLEAVMVIGQSPHAAGPRPLDHQVPAHTSAQNQHAFVHGCGDLLLHSCMHLCGNYLWQLFVNPVPQQTSHFAHVYSCCTCSTVYKATGAAVQATMLGTRAHKLCAHCICEHRPIHEMLVKNRVLVITQLVKQILTLQLPLPVLHPSHSVRQALLQRRAGWLSPASGG